MEVSVVEIQKVLCTCLENYMSFDLWLLLNVRRIVKFFVKVLGPLLKIMCIMTLGAGILFAYTLTHVKIDVPSYNGNYHYGKARYVKGGLLSIVDSSSADKSLLQTELARLKSRALSLEMSLRRMKSEFKNLHIRSRVRDEELADFASEAAGGSVLGTPNTEPYYQPNQRQATIFGIPIWTPNYFTPRKVIQPWTQAGECWAFKGSSGQIEIALAHAALIDQVTMEHIPASASLTGMIDSAPKKFHLLGNYRDRYMIIESFVYSINGPSSQTFHIKKRGMREFPFDRVILEIESNWGHPEYTCIYRFKVHGKMYKPQEFAEHDGLEEL